MQGWRDPVGPASAGAYWARRAVVILVPVLVIALVAVLVSWFTGKTPAAESSPSASVAVTKAPTGTPPPTPAAPAAQPTPAAPSTSAAATKPTPTGPTDCAPDKLQAQIAGNTGVKPGDETTFHLTVKNAGDQPCVAKLGPSQASLTITSGDVKVWTTADCGTWFGHDDTSTLDPGQTVAWDIAWPTKKSTGSCDASPEQLSPGTYVARFAWGDVKASYVLVLQG